VPTGGLYHIRVRVAAGQPVPLTTPSIATALLASVSFYHDTQRWHCPLFLLMPDHWHGLISFPPEKQMAAVIADWKRYHTRHLGITWQTNFFDHRLRNEREVFEKYIYILNNPVAKKLCATPADWPWSYRGGAGSPSTPSTPKP
jgi:hypothetical protein